jgi:two-component system NarL family sensor kinase
LLKVRNISYLLHPPLLDESGLLPALHWYFDGLQKRSKMRIAFDYKPAVFQRLSRELETAIFRIIQESLTNVYRHSQSEDARIEVHQQLDRVTVRIRDFGKGIGDGMSLITISPGIGICAMKERVKQLNGELKVSRAEPGTLVEAAIPII